MSLRLAVVVLPVVVVPHLADAAALPGATTDIGTLDRDTVAKPFKSKQTYSPPAGRSYPSRAARGADVRPGARLHLADLVRPALLTRA